MMRIRSRTPPPIYIAAPLSVSVTANPVPD
jgi:hypothetical protein